MMEIALNTRYHDTIQMTPFEADTGAPMRNALDIELNDIPNGSNKEMIAKQFIDAQVDLQKRFRDKLDADLLKLQEKIAIQQRRMQKHVNPKQLFKKFKTGDKVLLDTRNLDISHLGVTDDAKRKISHRYIGPFTIIRETTPDTYELDIKQKVRFHKQFHVSLLKTYNKDESHTRKNIPNKSLANNRGEHVRYGY